MFSLPKPVHQYEVLDARRPAAAASASAASSASRSSAPPYPSRAGWTPSTQHDFGDGGAYPEIAVAQYPLGMGRPGKVRSLAA